MFLSKETLYDWNGANDWIFRQVNALHGDVYDAAMVFLSRSADHHNFPYYMLALAVWALLGYMIHKTSHTGGSPQYLAAWFGVMTVLAAGYAADGFAVKQVKEDFAYSRPYIADHGVRTLDHVKDGDDEHRSFPSGHMSFATLMVLGLWPVLSTGMGLAGVIWLCGVGWSRMAEGMHFPADLLAGFLLTLLLVLILRAIIYAVIHKLLRIRC